MCLLSLFFGKSAESEEKIEELMMYEEEEGECDD